MNAPPIEKPTNGNHKDSEPLSQSIREWLRFGLEVLAFLALVCYVRATTEQVGISRNELVMSQRPWIGVERSHVVAAPTNNRISVQLTYGNTGHSPAEQVWFRALEMGPLDSDQIHQAEQWCAEKPTYSGVGLFVMPGQSYSITPTSEGLSDDTVKYISEGLNRVPEAHRTLGLKPQGIIMIGCIDYRWNKRCYRTRFCSQFTATPSDTDPYGVMSYCNFSNNTDENDQCDPPS